MDSAMLGYMKKIHLSLDLPKDVSTYMKMSADNDRMSLEEKAVDLLRKGLEMEEDEYFSKMAEERIKEGGEHTSHEEVWKKLL